MLNNRVIFNARNNFLRPDLYRPKTIPYETRCALLYLASKPKHAFGSGSGQLFPRRHILLYKI